MSRLMGRAEALRRVEQAGRDLTLLLGLRFQLEWDEAMSMPPAAAAARGRQLAYVAKRQQACLLDLELGTALASLADAELDPWTATTMRLVARERRRVETVDPAIVGRRRELASAALAAWAEAKRAGSFAPFVAPLTALVDVNREYAHAVGFTAEPYEALVEDYEPQFSASRFATLASALAPELTAVCGAAAGQSKVQPGMPELDPGRLIETFRRLARDIGFDLKFGRIDPAAFSFAAPNYLQTDNRIVIRIVPGRLVASILSLVHELGHGIYEQSLPREHRGLPCAWPTSVGMNEGQARWLENHVGRSEGFWQFALGLLSVDYPDELAGVDASQVVASLRHVSRGPLRTEADEVSYNLHIILRFELERALFSGRLAVKDLPEAWNAASERLLGVVPAEPATGILQDLHWASGMFGYFPTYLLGNIYAAQLDQALTRAVPDRETRVAAGDFKPLLAWMGKHVHAYGSLHLPDEIMELATGAPAGPEALLAHLRARYL